MNIKKSDSSLINTPPSGQPAPEQGNTQTETASRSDVYQFEQCMHKAATGSPASSPDDQPQNTTQSNIQNKTDGQTGKPTSLPDHTKNTDTEVSSDELSTKDRVIKTQKESVFIRQPETTMGQVTIRKKKEENPKPPLHTQANQIVDKSNVQVTNEALKQGMLGDPVSKQYDLTQTSQSQTTHPIKQSAHNPVQDSAEFDRLPLHTQAWLTKEATLKPEATNSSALNEPMGEIQNKRRPAVHSQAALKTGKIDDTTQVSEIVSGDVILHNVHPSSPKPEAVETTTKDRLEALNKLVKSIHIATTQLAGKGDIHITLKEGLLKGSTVQLHLSGNQLQVDVVTSNNNLPIISQQKDQLVQQLHDSCPTLRLAVSISGDHDNLHDDSRSRQQYIPEDNEDNL